MGKEGREINVERTQGSVRQMQDLEAGTRGDRQRMEAAGSGRAGLAPGRPRAPFTSTP